MCTERVKRLFHRRLVSSNDHVAGPESGLINLRQMSADFTIPPKRWIVKRTFAWLMRNRRLDWERLETSTEPWICLVMGRVIA